MGSFNQFFLLGKVRVTQIPEAKQSDGVVISGFWRRSYVDRPLVELPTYKRQAGATCGGHFHLGNDPSKAPENLRLVYGEVLLSLAAPDGKQEEISLNADESVVIEILIPPLFWHRLTCRSFCVFEEPRMTVFDEDNDDTVRCTVNDFPGMVRWYT